MPRATPDTKAIALDSAFRLLPKQYAPIGALLGLLSGGALTGGLYYLGINLMVAMADWLVDEFLTWLDPGIAAVALVLNVIFFSGSGGIVGFLAGRTLGKHKETSDSDTRAHDAKPATKQARGQSNTSKHTRPLRRVRRDV